MQDLNGGEDVKLNIVSAHQNSRQQSRILIHPKYWAVGTGHQQKLYLDLYTDLWMILSISGVLVEA
jgi:hypothetical protein